MLNPYIDLRKCEKGNILVLKDGSLAEYIEHREGEYFPHIIKYLNKNMGKGSRDDDGSMFKNNRREEDLDVVLVFKKGVNKKELLKNINERYERSR